jgi:hypothetical protein
MSAFEYATALALTAVTLGGAGLAGWGLRHRLLGDWSGAPAALATALAGLATLLLGAQLLGLAGLLNRPGLAVLMVAVGAAGAALRPWRGGARTLGPRLGPWAAMSCALGCGVVAAVWLRRGFLGFDVGMGGTDTLWFHMPFASAFAQSGSITALLHTDTQFANAFYPANSELLHATGMVLFGSDVISPLLNVAFLALLMLAGWCAGGPRGVAPVTCLGAAALAVLPTLATTQPGDAKNDTLALACMAAAVAFLLNGRGRRTPVALAGLAAGIAVGTKLSFAVPAALLLVAVPACVPRGRRASAAAVWTAAAALPAAVWFARNLAATGNPLPYVRHLGPIALPGPPAVAQSDTEFAVAHYLGHGGVWDEFFLPGLEYAFGPLWWLVLALAVAALLAGALRGAPTERGLALAGAGAALAYLGTPQTAAGPEGSPFAVGLNLRYLTPALLIAFLILPLLPPFGGRRSRWLPVLAFAAVFASAILAREPIFGPGYRAPAIAVAVLTVAGVAAIPKVAAHGYRPATGWTCAGLAAIALAVVGWPGQQRHAERAYTRASPPFSSYSGFGLDSAYLLAKRLSGERIGVSGMAGAFWQYPLSRDGLRNTVRYVGSVGPNGAFSAIEDCRSWRRALARGRYDYVVTTPRLDPWRVLAGGPAPEAAWTRGARGAVPVSAQDGVTVFRLTQPVSAKACS